MQLNPQQEEAANHVDGPCLVVAVPGSGKTRVLVERTIRLIKSGVDPRDIISLTFTNKAAKEMKDRIVRSIGYNNVKMFVGTFHSLCAKILRQYGEHVGLPKGFTILDSGEQKDFVNKIVKQKYLEFKKSLDSGAIAGVINDARENMLDISDTNTWDALFHPLCNGNIQLVSYMTDIALTYLKEVRRCKCVDFSGLLYESIIVMQNNDEPRNYLQTCHKYLQVDEAQDTNYAQFLFVNLLSEKHKNVFMVGDPDQCVAEDSMILTAHGLRSAISLNEGDYVLSGCGQSRLSEQKITRKCVKKLSNQKMVKITTFGGKTLLTTPNHSHFAGYTGEYKGKLFFTYLMYKDGYGFRVGITNNLRKSDVGQSGRGYASRSRQEHADKMWLLKVSHNRNEAVFWEQLFSVKYGLPTWIYRPSLSGSYGKEMDEYSKKIFSEIDTEKGARNLLQHLGLCLEFPHHIPKCMLKNRRNFSITICGDGRTYGNPLHKYVMSGSEDGDRKKIEAIGFKTRPAKNNKGWRIESSYRSLATIKEIASKVEKCLPINIIEGGRFSDHTLPLLPASHVLPYMNIFIYDESKNEIINDMVASIESVNYSGSVVDFDIEDCHNFVANGILTHNSIYAFRGARYQNIEDFVKNNENCKIIKLTYNYRSTPQIVKSADLLIKHNKGRIDKVFETQNDSGNDVVYKEFSDPEQESIFIANQIFRLVSSSSLSPRNFVILYRTNFMSRALEEACVNAGIPYKIVGGFSFYERAEIKDCLSMLKLFVNDRDIVAFSRVAGLLDGIGPKAIKSIEEYSFKEKIGLIQACIKMHKHMNRVCQASVQLLLEAYACPHKDAASILKYIIQSLHYEGILRNSGKSDIDERIENVFELINSIEKDENSKLGVDEFLQKISLYSSADESAEKNQITMMTMHAVKGLEFPVVFVVGVEQGLLPHARAMEEEGGEEEERRLFYVAMTRAEKHLFVSSCRRRKVGAYSRDYRVCSPSPFLIEAGLRR